MWPPNVITLADKMETKEPITNTGTWQQWQGWELEVEWVASEGNELNAKWRKEIKLGRQNSYS